MRRRRHLPAYFADTSVFIELMLKQEESKICASFFQREGYKFRLVTSTVVMGEIIKIINGLKGEATKQKNFHFLSDILMDRRIEIISVSFAAIGNIGAIKLSDPFLPSSDCLIFSTAVTENSSYFITLDKHFSAKLGRDFKIPVKNPSEI